MRSCSPRTILVVADNVPMRRFLESVVKEQGYRLAIARHAAEAVSLADRVDPAATLIDVMLQGGVDSISMIHLLRRSRRGGVIIMVAGSGTASTAREAMLAGADDYIAGPMSQRLVRSVLSEAVVSSPGACGAGLCAP